MKFTNPIPGYKHAIRIDLPDSDLRYKIVAVPVSIEIDCRSLINQCQLGNIDSRYTYDSQEDYWLRHLVAVRCISCWGLQYRSVKDVAAEEMRVGAKLITCVESRMQKLKRPRTFGGYTANFGRAIGAEYMLFHDNEHVNSYVYEAVSLIEGITRINKIRYPLK